LKKKGRDVDDDLFEQKEIISDSSAFECEFTLDLVDSLKLLWNDQNIQKAFSHRDETAILDHMEYFYGKIDDLVDGDYIPTNEDILKARIRTIGYDAVTFNMKGASMRIYDVGGQKTERNVWSTVMKDVESCIFCVSFADFDKPTFEDQSILRINDSLNLFEKISKNPKFMNGPGFLLCNKMDDFEKKIKKAIVLQELFPSTQENRMT
jgi:hypothetical protein